LTILITGATGLVGNTLVQYLLNDSIFTKNPTKIRLLVRKKEGDFHRQQFLTLCGEKDIEIFYGDLRNELDIQVFTNVSDPESSILIHLGAIFNFWQPYELLHDVNVRGTERILQAFHQNNIRKLIHISSVAVYGCLNGSDDGRGVTEDHPIDLNQRKNYELTKALSEKLVLDYQEAHPNRLITIFRPSGIIGGSGVTLDVFSRMFFGKFVPLPKGGKDKISLVDVNDVVRAISLCINFNIGNGEIYNLVSFTPTLKQLVEELAMVLRRKITILSIPLFLFKPMYFISRVLRKFKKPTENSIFLPILFDKLGQDVWVDDMKARMIGFQSISTLDQSMRRYGKFLTENPGYIKEKTRFVL